MAPGAAMKVKAIFLIYLILSCEAIHTAKKPNAAETDSGEACDASPADVAKATYNVYASGNNVYASGNCQFFPLDEIERRMREMAPTAAAGSGLLAKPAISPQLPDGSSSGSSKLGLSDTSLSMGTKASLVGKMAGSALGMSSGVGLAIQIGMTTHELWKLRDLLGQPNAVCSMVSKLIPPFDTSGCDDGEGFLGGIIPLKMLGNPAVLYELWQLRSQLMDSENLCFLVGLIMPTPTYSVSECAGMSSGERLKYFVENLPEFLQSAMSTAEGLPELLRSEPVFAKNVPDLMESLPFLPEGLPKLLNTCEGLPETLSELLRNCPRESVSEVNFEGTASGPRLLAMLARWCGDVPNSIPDLLKRCPDLSHNLIELLVNLPELPASLPQLLQDLATLPQNLPDLLSDLPNHLENMPSILMSLPHLPKSLPELENFLSQLPLGLPTSLKNCPGLPGYLTELVNTCPQLWEPGVPKVLLDDCPGLPQDFSERLMTECPAISESFVELLLKLPKLTKDIPEELADLARLPTNILDVLTALPRDLYSLRATVPSMLRHLPDLPMPLRVLLQDCSAFADNLADIVEGLPSLPEDLDEMLAGCPNVPNDLQDLLKGLVRLPQKALDYVSSLSQRALPTLFHVFQNVLDPALRDFLADCPALAENLPDIVSQLPWLPDDLVQMVVACPNVPGDLVDLLKDLINLPDDFLAGLDRLSRRALPGLLKLLPHVNGPLREMLANCPKLAENLPDIVQNLPRIPRDLPEIVRGCPDIPDGFEEMIQGLTELPPVVADAVKGLSRAAPLISSSLPLVLDRLPIPKSLRECLLHCPDLVERLPPLLLDLSNLRENLGGLRAHCDKIPEKFEQMLTSGLSDAALALLPALPYLVENFPKLTSHLPNLLEHLPALAQSVQTNLDAFVANLMKTKAWLSHNLPKFVKTFRELRGNLWDLVKTLPLLPDSYADFTQGLRSLPSNFAQLLGNGLTKLPRLTIANLPVSPGVAVAGVAVLLVGFGAFKLWQRRLRDDTFGRSFCPTSRWSTNPSMFLEEQKRGSAEEEKAKEKEKEKQKEVDVQGMDELEDEAELVRGMGGKCSGLSRHRSPFPCPENDIHCRMAVCRQMCCNSNHCSMFQFQAGDIIEDGFPVANTFDCRLGPESRFNTNGCDEWGGFVKVSGSHGHHKYELHPRLHRRVFGLSKLQIPTNLTRGEAESDIAHLTRMCRTACSGTPECKFVSFLLHKHRCWYGSKPVEDYVDDTEILWYGGILDGDIRISSKQGCPAGTKKCPASGKGAHSRCVESCSNCNGFGSEDSDGVCARTAVQAVCNPSQWIDTHAGTPLSQAWCSGLRRQVVTMDEDTDFNGHAVCREVCCGDPTCVLYQVSTAMTGDGGLKKGDSVHCWLGKQFNSQVDMFECRQRHFKGAFGRQFTGGYLAERGCSSGYSCLISGECVESCAAQCPGAPMPDHSAGSCIVADIEDEEATPEVASDDIVGKSRGEYYLHHGKATPRNQSSAADTLLMVAQNRHRLVKPGAVSVESCSAFAVGDAMGCEPSKGGCECKYITPKVCPAWFDGPFRIRPVIAKAGLILVSSNTCTCDIEAHSCHFGFMDTVPPIKVASTDVLEVNVWQGFRAGPKD